MDYSPKLRLASGSPRRRDLLTHARYAFDVVCPEVDETPRPEESPVELVKRLAEAKARSLPASDAVVLAADTIVVLNGRILGKPEDKRDAVEMLLSIAGRKHTVYTGFAVVSARDCEVAVVASDVHMFEVDRETAIAYAAGGEPLDKSGAYALQGEGGRFVRTVDGSRSNVIGLPMECVGPVLRRFGIAPR